MYFFSYVSKRGLSQMHNPFVFFFFFGFFWIFYIFSQFRWGISVEIPVDSVLVTWSKWGLLRNFQLSIQFINPAWSSTSWNLHQVIDTSVKWSIYCNITPKHSNKIIAPKNSNYFPTMKSICMHTCPAILNIVTFHACLALFP